MYSLIIISIDLRSQFCFCNVAGCLPSLSWLNIMVGFGIAMMLSADGEKAILPVCNQLFRRQKERVRGSETGQVEPLGECHCSRRVWVKIKC